MRVYLLTIAAAVEMLASPLTSPAIPSGLSVSDVQQSDKENARIWDQAKKFEASFIAEMLKHSGMSEALNNGSGFGGEAFSSIMLEQYADKIVEGGGFGLAEHIYEQLRDKESGHDANVSA